MCRCLHQSEQGGSFSGSRVLADDECFSRMATMPCERATSNQSGKRHQVVSLLPLRFFSDSGHFSVYLPGRTGYPKEVQGFELLDPSASFNACFGLDATV